MNVVFLVGDCSINQWLFRALDASEQIYAGYSVEKIDLISEYYDKISSEVVNDIPDAFAREVFYHEEFEIFIEKVKTLKETKITHSKKEMLSYSLN